MRLPPQLRSTTTRALCSALERDGFVLDRQRGSHRIYYNPTDNRRVVVSYHGEGATIPYGTLKGIITDLDWTIEDLKRLQLI